ncbi:MAG: lipid A deacylase LpxR family protein [Bacteroidota bacterium]
MRVLYILLVSLLFFTACHRPQQVKVPDLVMAHSPLVIDYPAGVMITTPKRHTSPASRNLTYAEKVLSLHRIPLLDTNTREMVFVKTNGDRVRISMEELAGKYDIILFNTVNNPVPLRIADLQGAFNQIFNITPENNISAGSRNHLKKVQVYKPDTLPEKPIFNLFQRLKSREKRIIISMPDTTTQRFVTRIIPGIVWVEQRIDTRTILKFNFENDLITYANTDRYFTNGITFDLQAAWLSQSVIQKIMIPYQHKATVTYNLSMVQDMYTPTDTRIAPALSHDRPYSSYLYFGFRRTISDPLRKIKMSSQLDAGYLGPYSPGSYLQTLVHKTFPTNDTPQGWNTQINTDVILNYSLQAQKAVVSKKSMTLLAGVDIKAGTLYNNAGVGLQFQAGKADPVFGLAENEKWPDLECYFFAKTHISIVAYNALLQGGMFNHDNVFTLKGNEIQRVVGTAESGIHVRYKAMGLELAQHYLTPEYKGGLWHKWGRISLLFRL